MSSCYSPRPGEAQVIQSWLRWLGLALIHPEDFHRIYHQAGKVGLAWGTTTWQGRRCAQNPLDLWVIGELIWKHQPRWLIETGTGEGGSARWYATILNLLNKGGQVITTDRIAPVGPHEFIFYKGSSLETIADIRERVRGDQTMVILDSDHRQAHVTAELNAYAPLVTPGQYLVVSDTHFNGHPVDPHFGPGPMEALDEWLPAHPEFLIDRSQERHLLTFNPGGFLRRV